MLSANHMSATAAKVKFPARMRAAGAGEESL